MTNPTTAQDEKKRRVVIITGLAGAGRNVARTTLEDIGYEVIDNPPLDHLQALLAPGQVHPLALGIDSRTRGFSAERVLELIKQFTARPDLSLKLLYLDCDDDVLLRRFSETRRTHPLAADRSVMDGILKERELVGLLKARADLSLDTSTLGNTELRQIVTHHFDVAEGRGLAIQVMSFSYRHGVPREADYIFDARFLRNPHWDEKLRPFTGQNADVGAYISADESFAPFWQNLQSLLKISIEQLSKGGRNYLTIGFGCTGGKHRSVYLAEQTYSWLKDNGYHALLSHRELDKLK
jgi:UPF0042 nucleotide-binding protein